MVKLGMCTVSYYLLLATYYRTVLRVATGHRLRGIHLQVAEQRRDTVALVRAGR